MRGGESTGGSGGGICRRDHRFRYTVLFDPSLSRPIDRGPTDRPTGSDRTALGAPTQVLAHFSRLFRYLIGQYVTVHGDVISHLNISVSKVKDGGLYSCVAVNRAGSATHSSRLNLYGPPLIRPFPASGLKAVEGRAFVVHCPVAGFPIEEVAWKKGESSSLRSPLHH